MTKTIETPIVVPEAVRRKAGLRRGERIEFRVSGRVITIQPEAATDEYTADQRRVIDTRLAEAKQDVQAGRVHGPFTPKQATTFIEGLAKERGGKRVKHPKR